MSLARRSFGVGLLLLSGCDVARDARNDLMRLTSPQAKALPAVPAVKASTVAKVRTAPKSGEDDEKTTPASNAPPVTLVGRSESEIRALLGAPTSEEDRAPGKTWRYQDGQCTVNIHLYPDVQTRQFGTLAYEVRSDDNTDEGKRLCLGQLRSRIQAQQG